MTNKKPSGCYRLLHTADWHLGKMLNDQSRDEEHAQFLTWLLLAVKEHEVDAIVLAGDVFDSANPPQSAQALYYNFVSELFKQDRPALVVVAGNHDSAALLESPKKALRALNVHVVGLMAETPAERVLLLPSQKNPLVAVAMIPFLRDRDLRTGKAGESATEIQRQLVEGIRARYEETAACLDAVANHCPAIATGHLTVAGSISSDAEREIHIGGLGAVGSDAFPARFGYVALGHLHRPQVAGGDARVRYSGSPFPLSFSEVQDSKEVRILDIEAGGISHQSLPVPRFRPLHQIRSTMAELEADISKFEPHSGSLEAWVEVVVSDASLQDDLNSRVQELVESRNFKVLKVLRGGMDGVTGLGAEDRTDDEAIDSLLENPLNVFDHLLAQKAGLTPEELDQLRTAFSELLDKRANQ